MEKLAKNPFKFGNPVQGDYYYPRPELSRTVRQFLENQIHVMLMGPRRFGKTSFVLDVFSQFEEAKYQCVLVDIFNITSHRDFLQQLLRALRKKQSFKNKIKNFWKKIGGFSPQINLDFDSFTGNPNLNFSLEKLPQEDLKRSIQDLLDAFANLGNKVIVAFDEFQQISQIDDKGWLEATVRTHLQKLPNVSFLLTGSRKSLLSDMLNDPSRPLYRSCQAIEFPSLNPQFSDWITSRFNIVGIQCEIHTIDYLRELVQDTPNYVQMVCFQIVAQGRPYVGKQEIDQALDSVARQNAYAYQTLLNSLSLAQQRTLRLAANEKTSLFQKHLLTKYEITSAPGLHNSIKALKKKGILDEEGTRKGNVLFDDPLFAYWLKVNFPV